MPGYQLRLSSSFIYWYLQDLERKQQKPYYNTVSIHSRNIPLFAGEYDVFKSEMKLVLQPIDNIRGKPAAMVRLMSFL